MKYVFIQESSVIFERQTKIFLILLIISQNRVENPTYKTRPYKKRDFSLCALRYFVNLCSGFLQWPYITRSYILIVYPRITGTIRAGLADL